MQQGHAAFKRQEYRLACAKFRQAFLAVRKCDLSDPRTSSSLRYLGDSFLKDSRLAEAADCYQREADILKQLSPTFPDLPYDYYQLSLIRFRQSRLSEALDESRHAWQIRREHHSIHTPSNSKILLQLVFLEALASNSNLNLKLLESLKLGDNELRELSADLLRSSQVFLQDSRDTSTAKLPTRKLVAELSLKGIQMLRQYKIAITTEHLDGFVQSMINLSLAREPKMLTDFALQSIDLTLAAGNHAPHTIRVLLRACADLLDANNPGLVLEMTKKIRPVLDPKQEHCIAHLCALRARAAATLGKDSDYKLAFQECASALPGIEAGSLKNQITFHLSWAAAKMADNKSCYKYLMQLPKSWSGQKTDILLTLAKACHQCADQSNERKALQEAARLAANLNDKAVALEVRNQILKLGHSY